MYLISKLNKDSLAAVNQLSSQGHARSVLFPIALGYVISRTLSLPVEKIDHPEQYFRITHDLSVQSMLSDFNELLPHDTKRSMELTKSFFQHRAYAQHPAEHALAFRDMKGIRDFFGLSRSFSDETLDLIKNHSADLSVIVSLVLRISSQLIKVEEEDVAQ